MKRLNPLSAALCLACLPRLCAAGGAGADPFNFLFLDANARAVGMGGAYTALASDANALQYNPAGLAGVGAHEATFMHNQYFAGVSQEYAGLASARGLGASVNLLRSGDVPRTTVSNPDGTGLGSASMTDLALAAGFGARLAGPLAVGAAGRYIRQSIDDVRENGFALDFGAMWRPPSATGLRLGLALQNLGPDVSGQGAKEKLPLNARAGGAYGFTVRGDPAVVALDLSKERAEGVLLAVGAEVELDRMIPVRLGFNTRNDDGPGITAGLGWRFQDFQLDYAFVPYKDFGATHRFSVTCRWGSRVQRSLAEQSAPPAVRMPVNLPPPAAPAAVPEPVREPAPAALPVPPSAPEPPPPTAAEVAASSVPAGAWEPRPSGTALPPSPAPADLPPAPTEQVRPEPDAPPARAASAPVVAQVQVLGLRRTPESVVRGMMCVREGTAYPERSRLKDLAALRASGWFWSADVAVAPLTADTLRVDVTVMEVAGP